MWQFLTRGGHTLPPMSRGPLTTFSHPALAFLTGLSFQEESAGGYSCGWYLNRDCSLAWQDISVHCAVGTGLFGFH